MTREEVKKKFVRREERDMFGTPKNRAKTWGNMRNDPKKSRRDWSRRSNRNRSEI